MATRVCALVLGLIYILVGLAGVLPGSAAERSPVGLLQQLGPLLLGVWGVVAFRTRVGARVFAQAFALAALSAAVLVVAFGADRVLGTAPLHADALPLHIAALLAAGYWGFARPTVSAGSGGQPATPSR